MNKSRILSLCNQIEMIVATVCDTGYTLQPGDEEAIFNRVREIMNEVNAPPKSNSDFIRHMTDEELAHWLNNEANCTCNICIGQKEKSSCTYYMCEECVAKMAQTRGEYE